MALYSYLKSRYKGGIDLFTRHSARKWRSIFSQNVELFFEHLSCRLQKDFVSIVINNLGARIKSLSHFILVLFASNLQMTH